MAYMSQEKKKEIEAVVKPICRKHGVKATLAVRHHSTLVLNIAEGSIDFFAERTPYLAPWGREDLAEASEKARACEKERGNMDVHRAEEFAEGTRARAFFEEVVPALNKGNYDRSDIMTDYFDVGWYVDMNVGRWNKPYRLNPALAPKAPPPGSGKSDAAKVAENEKRMAEIEAELAKAKEPAAEPEPEKAEKPPSCRGLSGLRTKDGLEVLEILPANEPMKEVLHVPPASWLMSPARC